MELSITFSHLPFKPSVSMNITQLHNSYHSLSGEQMHQINEFVARALLHVVHQHIINVTSSLVLTVCCRNHHTCNFYNEMMTILFRNWGFAPLQIVNIKPEVPWQTVPGRRHFNVIFTDSYAAFSETRVAQYSQEYNYNEYYLIFLQTRDHLHQTEMRAIFNYCWRHQFIHCNILVQKSNGEILIYTYYPYSRHSCSNMEPRLINRYNGQSLINPVLFPRKLVNLHGCPLRAVLWTVAPFFKLTENKGNRSDSHISGGFEGTLLLTLAKKMNFSVKILRPQSVQVREEALGMLQRREADLSLGGFRHSVPRASLATSTLNYYQTRETFAVLDASYELSSLDIMFYPYPLEIWLGLIGVAALAILVQFVFDRFLPEPRHHWLNLYLIFVGMPLLDTPRFHASRLYCIMLMSYTLVIRTVYQGLLYHLIRTHQLNRMPQSIDEIVRENYTVVITSSVNVVLSEIPSMDHMNFRVINTPKETGSLDFIVQNRHCRRHALVSSEDVIIHYNRRIAEQAQRMGQREVLHFEIIPEDVINFQLTMYLTKHSFLIDQFNEEIIWMRSMGLLAAWAHWELDENYLRKGESYRMLDLEELYAYFVLMVLGWGLSLIVFMFEIWSQFWWQLQRWFM